MPQVYVSGPVVRRSPGWDLPPWVDKAYNEIETAVRSWRHDPVMPLVNAALDKQRPDDFFRSIRKQIGGSKVVIGVFTPGDVSVAVEASIGSALGKDILLIAEDTEDVPRLLAGLPGVEVVSNGLDLGNAVGRFLGTKNGPQRPG